LSSRRPPGRSPPHGDIDAHLGVTRELDHEAELGVVIGRGGREITRERAFEHVWGYTILDDVTARDLHRRHQPWFIGKSPDTFTPMGPWAVTADEIGDLSALVVSATVNGELRQHAPVAEPIFGIPELIGVIPAGITLQPGDTIATGTPAGVGIGFDPPRETLAPGQDCTAENPTARPGEQGLTPRAPHRPRVLRHRRPPGLAGNRARRWKTAPATHWSTSPRMGSSDLECAPSLKLRGNSERGAESRPGWV
jgi:2-keto-4-pentenoate hydratase/2-oxohepta-3-ene-1,7-dioic acid hydratase in catechol pathway